MKILVYGAGVVGSIYAARLRQSGNEVTVLARGERAAELREHGIVLEQVGSGKRTTTLVPVIERIPRRAVYDLMVVAVRDNQAPDILPAVAYNGRTPTVLFLVSNAAGPNEWLLATEPKRLVMGIPGVVGALQDGVVRYMMAPRPLLPTTIGEYSGKITRRLRELAHVLREAGFDVALDRHIDDALKAQVAVMSPLAEALYHEGGDLRLLSHDRPELRSIVEAVREGLRVLHASGMRTAPRRLRDFERLPVPLLTLLMRHALRARTAEVAFAALAAHDEMEELAAQFQAIAHQVAAPTPDIDELCAAAGMDRAPRQPSGALAAGF
jgi:2-dehydropantoate 2-reductase